ncbi:MAG: helix-turn-helix transcriptional regulator [Mesorhizobium sp.]|uniref:helix-turn-helix domain-containing protein n=1 Tax=Mesorhizobium sp. TaxID=1871066 RepID=UPI000FE4AC42|nr:helix-turn-helix transcriptional regulator [Mesorhizobium sp.]RWM21724.1 MAG: LuxR family transcriptional regulator [Mesorhizobium sp.]TIP73399.1 MAG: helix-turn-helix transcriptional regulator [Mesorhizobium sp.]TIQ12075.1 MAG: helix-turn-helix transcriptional regulator [Mesorhizobium sp.]TIR51434.1 MAG: helix-turn-helix transcriptional regulator [Mesorhizobium sp.]TJV96980.1 MAG: helix-turn-helix transcriptional regulator [Mesorhizobium sp.]
MARHGITGRRLTVLIALDDAARAEHLSTALAATGDLLPIVAGSSNSADRADVAVIDDNYLERRGLEGGANDPAIPQVLLSQRASRQRPADTVFAVLPAAADDLLIAAAARLAAAGYRISGEGRFLSDRHDDFAFHDDDLSDEEPVDYRAERPALSPRESEVLALLAEGAPNKVIARRLNISVHTAKFHVAAILIKLGAANRTDAIAIAMRQGLVLV